MNVIHPRHGLGTIVSQTEENVTVLFEVGEKTLIKAFAGLTLEDGSDFYVAKKKPAKKAKTNKFEKRALAEARQEAYAKANPIQVLINDIMVINNVQYGDRNGSIMTLWIDTITPIASRARKEDNKLVVDILANAYRTFRISEKQAQIIANF